MNMPESRLSRGHYGIAIVVANKQKMKIKGGEAKGGSVVDFWGETGSQGGPLILKMNEGPSLFSIFYYMLL